MNEKTSYRPSTEDPADRIVALLRGIDEETSGIDQCQKEYQKELRRRLQRRDALQQELKVLLLSEHVRGALTTSPSAAQYIPGKQKFGWDTRYRLESLHTMVNSIQIEAMPFNDFELAFTGEGEPQTAISIIPGKAKAFADLLFFLLANKITVNKSLQQVILDRCTPDGKTINKDTLTEYISLSRKAFSSRGSLPLYESTSQILKCLDRTKLMSD